MDDGVVVEPLVGTRVFDSLAISHSALLGASHEFCDASSQTP